MKTCPRCGKEYEDTNTLCPTDGTVLEKTSDELIGQTLAGKYRIEELINEGGMGAVYRGTHTLMDKTVAVKVLHPALAADDKIVARFSREAKAASRISHPHALNVTDFGESENGTVFLVMEYLRGHTLKEVIRHDGPMTLPRVLEITRQVSAALDAAHAQGVVHRDLKSDNIMLEDVGDGDWAKVLDFGIAKIQEPMGAAKDPALTAANMIIGTPQYMSPEQCSQASEIDQRSDIYSLGAILYEMLAGHVPFTGENPTAIMMKHLQEPPPSIMEERADLPAGVGRVIARAMAKRPEDRYQSAGELAEALNLAAEAKAEAVAETTSTSPNARDGATNRIVVPTGPNSAPRTTASEDYDEATVVHPKREPVAVVQSEIFSDVVPPPPDRFNPWRVIIPSAAALLVVFAVIYALTRNSGQANSNQPSQPLVSDPQGLPVQPAQPATGQGEQGITSSLPTGSPTASGSPGTTLSTGASSGAGVNQNQSTDPIPVSNGNSNERGNSNRREGNDNTSEENNGEDESPSPAPNRNSNQREKPSPQPTQQPGDDDDEPPPQHSPTPKPKPALPKPTTPPSDVSPPAVGPNEQG